VTYRIHATKKYRKDIKRLAKSCCDLSELEHVIDLLAQGKKLPAVHCNHTLKGRFVGLEECHIAPDWLLIYERDQGELTLVLVRTGSHSELLGC